MQLRRTKWPVVGAVIVAGLATGSALAVAASPSRPAKLQRQALVRTPQVRSAATARAAAVESGFASLVQKASLATVPQAIKDFASSASEDWGLDVTQVRAVQSGSTTWYIIPGTKGMCFYRSHLGGCGSLENAAAGRLFVAGLSGLPSAGGAKPTANELIGIVPDGIGSVSAGGASSPVVANTYDIVDADATEFTLHDAAGASTVVPVFNK